jgi:hypothetical protein
MFQGMLKGLKERRGSADTMFMDSNSSFRAGSHQNLLTVSYESLVYTKESSLI